MDHPECDCNNHIEEALAHVCSSNNDSNNGTMGKYEAGRPVVATAVGNYTFPFWWRE